MWAPDNYDEKPPLVERINDPQELLSQLIECLHCKDGHRLKTYILEHKLKDQSIFWELILKIGECINAENYESEPVFFDICSRCIMYLVKVGNAKETLLALLEQMDTFIDDVKYKCFLPLIQTSLTKIPSKLFHSLDIALETVSAHLRALALPENVQLEGEEVKLFHADKTVVRLVDNLQAYLEFLEPFIIAIDLKRDKQANSIMQEAKVLKKHIVQIFDQPLCHLILTCAEGSDQNKSDCRLCAEQAMRLLTHLETNFYRFLKNAQSVDITDKDILPDDSTDHSAIDEEQDNKENEQKAKDIEDGLSERKDIVANWDFKMHVSNLARACIAYLIHHELLGVEKFPAIFSHHHILEFHLDSLSLMLKNTSYPINMKGLLLTKSLVQLLPEGTISCDFFDNPAYLTVINDLITIMIKCPVKDHRKLATTIFPLFIRKFDAGARYRIYISILSSCSNSGVKGFLITCLKNDIANHINIMKQTANGKVSSCKDGINSMGSCQFFTGKSLRKLLLLSLDLPEKETSDMLENSDQIISGINLLRFLVLADTASANLTQFWDYFSEIDKVFIKPLWRGLELSKAHYKLEFDNVNQGRPSGVGDKGNTDVSVSVSGMTLPTMEKKEKLELIEKAVNTHDIMLGLLGRLSELIDQSKL